MDFKARSARSPDRGILEVSMCISPRPLNKLTNPSSDDMKENKLTYETPQVLELKKEISDLQGRLYEARSSRDVALKKNVHMQESHLASLKQLQEVIDKLESKNRVLQKERDVDAFEQVKVLEAELQRVHNERVDLRHRLDNVSKQNSQRESEVLELSQKVNKLEAYIRNLETQREEFLETAQEYLMKNKEYEMQKGATEVLQQQLDKCMQSWDQVKNQLSEERMRCRELETELGKVEKERNHYKVDVRLLTREKKELEEKLEKQLTHSSSANDRVADILKAKQEAEENRRKAERECESLKNELQKLNTSLEEKQNIIKSQSSQIQKLEETVATLKKDIRETTAKLTELEQYKAKSEETEGTVKEQSLVMEEKDKTIERLQKGTERLKEACVMLEKQLKGFEVLLDQQQKELESSNKSRVEAETKVSELKEELRKTKVSLNEVTSLKLFTEKKLANVESTLKSGEAERIEELQRLQSNIVDLKRSNGLLTEKMSDLLDRLDELQSENEDLKKKTQSFLEENQLLKEESSKTLTQVMTLKESNGKLTAALEEAVTKCEKYRNRLESVSEDLALLEVGQAEKELRLQSALNQQIKLIEHLKDQNDVLSAKKKKHFGGKLFHRDHSKDTNKEPSTPISHLTKPISNATPRRLIHEHKVVKTLEEEAEYLKNQLALLQKQKDVPPTPEPLKAAQRVETANSAMEMREEELRDSGFQKTTIFADEGNDRLEVNCVKAICSSLFLLGCDQGLFSRKVVSAKPKNTAVQIEGPTSVYQIEFIPTLNYAMFVEGKDRRLAFAHLSLVKACSEAAACSKPKVKLQNVLDLKNVHSFYIQRTSEGETFIVAALQKHLNILFWEKDSFVLRHTLKTPDTVTCVLATQQSVIFGCDKIFELDIKHFTMEEFVDESDESMVYAMLACREAVNFPVAILDVSRSTATPAESRTEYLLCFPDVAIFVDPYGRRSRSEDIMWSKLPLGVYYRHPNLFVVHFNSVEVYHLGPKSFTRERKLTSQDSLGKEDVNIPKSKFVSLTNTRYLGNGAKNASLIVGSLNKSKFEILDLEPPTMDY